MLTVLMIEPGRKPYVTEIGEDLKSLQAAVDCDTIQAIYPYEEPVALMMDEMPSEDKALNRALRDEDGHIYDVIKGKFFVVGLGTEDFASLEQEYIEQFTELFNTPEMFVSYEGKIVVFPMPEELRKPI